MKVLNSDRIEEPQATYARPAIEVDAGISYDRSGRRCVCPPDFVVISWELRKWFGLYDAEAAREKANADGAAHRKKYGMEKLPDAITHDNPRQTG